MSSTPTPFPIGTPGVPWTTADRVAWRASVPKRRSYVDEVVSAIERLASRFEIVSYGALDYGGDGRFPLLLLKSRGWVDGLPIAMVTGGVHGYETSGVHGALRFAERDASTFEGRLNLLIAPCVSPWSYERIQRWNPDAVDPNRSFKPGGAAAEASLLMAYVAPYRGRFLAHLDLHETTDSDESEFRPALAARDGKPFEPGEIPDGFYLVDDAANPQLGFQQAIIRAVEAVTHIAEADDQGRLIGEPLQSRGIVNYDAKPLGLCVALTGARFTTTTEVYPDSPRSTPAQCNEAQATAVRAGFEFALGS
ncbi:MAG: M14 family metallocarboxypeptidase [Archangium sp.]|nr:M14 family metallocarboxypeptidase [Archangium sp.]MDP3569720.1 M14 family metallocarboxypeptidase [Archangium sp.]